MYTALRLKCYYFLAFKFFLLFGSVYCLTGSPMLIYSVNNVAIFNNFYVLVKNWSVAYCFGH